MFDQNMRDVRSIAQSMRFLDSQRSNYCFSPRQEKAQYYVCYRLEWLRMGHVKKNPGININWVLMNHVIESVSTNNIRILAKREECGYSG